MRHNTSPCALKSLLQAGWRFESRQKTAELFEKKSAPQGALWLLII
jgi:hypothetical protein